MWEGEIVEVSAEDACELNKKTFSMEEEALMFEASVVQPFEWQREHYAVCVCRPFISLTFQVAASVVIFGGGSLWLLHKLRKNGAITIKPETRVGAIFVPLL